MTASTPLLSMRTFATVCGTLLASVLLLAPANVFGQDTPVVVDTITGPIQGLQTILVLPDLPVQQISLFLGIPYATPPVGDLRFKPPVYPHPSWTAVREALEYGPSCVQDLSKNRVPGYTSEDCLLINVFAPINNHSRSLPVMVWIHGGGYRYGSSTMPLYDGGVLAAFGEVIVVTFNYRLGAFGFMASAIGEYLPGNMGLQDQQAALRWVNQNIAVFGGNPESVTVFGESAGAEAIGLHLTSPQSANLFGRAIAESGSMLSPSAVQGITNVTLATQALAQNLNCLVGFEADIECMRRVTSAQLLQAQAEVYTVWSQQKRLSPYTPVIDGKVIPMDPLTALRINALNPVTLLTGTNHDEWGLMALEMFSEQAILPGMQPGITPTEFNASVNTMCKHGFRGFSPAGTSAAVCDTIKFTYTDWNQPAWDAGRLQQLIKVGTDMGFVCPQQTMADYWTAYGRHLYQYQFSYFLGLFPEWAGVAHSAEVPFVFGTPLRYKSYPKHPLYPSQPIQFYYFTEEDRNVSLSMMEMWSSFARTGIPAVPPGGNGTGGFTTVWPPYSSLSRQYVDIGRDVVVGLGFLHNDKCQLFTRLAPAIFANCSSTWRPTQPCTRNVEVSKPDLQGDDPDLYAHHRHDDQHDQHDHLHREHGHAFGCWHTTWVTVAVLTFITLSVLLNIVLLMTRKQQVSVARRGDSQRGEQSNAGRKSKC